ncbi:hypothetical protein LshimejAT787_1801500 [Lyophyllum shimeji]|uniref:Uncharacterized protein n=1 Tax=Lyophyllum shimeji TaxID=47721 RepID=A0A9P3UTP3_LYOSH|nr:hypothetical protein LshimejAT787_1801500 [Lyophyllum shimeji]
MAKLVGDSVQRRWLNFTLPSVEIGGYLFLRTLPTPDRAMDSRTFQGGEEIGKECPDARYQILLRKSLKSGEGCSLPAQDSAGKPILNNLPASM